MGMAIGWFVGLFVAIAVVFGFGVTGYIMPAVLGFVFCAAGILGGLIIEEVWRND